MQQCPLEEPESTEEIAMQTREHPSGHQRPRDEFDTIVVGVDGSERNHAAVAWACHEADETKKKLVFVAGDDGLPIPAADGAVLSGLHARLLSGPDTADAGAGAQPRCCSHFGSHRDHRGRVGEARRHHLAGSREG